MRDHSLRPTLLPLSAAVIAIACLLGAGCTQDDDKGTGTTPDPTEDPTTEDPTPPECSYRPDPTPPEYTWSFQEAAIGRTTLRYHATPSPVGLVALFDGGAGSSIWFNRIEPRLLVEALVDAGYAVMALESDDPADGNFDGTDAATNVDIVNLQAAISLAEGSGLVPAGTPRFYLGFSSGGYFASLATRYEPANALALLNVRGDTVTYDPTMNPSLPPPTIWVVGRNDDMVPPSDPDLLQNVDNLVSAGVDHALYVNEPIGAEDDAFARIADPVSSVSLADSDAAVADLAAEGYLDDCRVPTDSSARLDLSVITLGPTFTPEFTDEAKRQIDELFGAHEVTSDFKAEIVAFFNAHL